ncbi:MAG: hypothetical protein WCJ92_08220 [Alphaproteobacteria bacterium]
MNFFSFLYPKSSTKGKILYIQKEIKNLIKPICTEKFWVTYYGSYNIDPKNLVFWICVQSDKMKYNLQNTPNLNAQSKELLTIQDYPEEDRQFVLIGFEFEETVQRKSNGNWYHHF